MRKQKLAVFFVLTSLSLPCVNGETKKNKLWKFSAAVLGAVTIADVHSSLGRRELNPLLRSQDGRFSARGVSIKTAIVGAGLGSQYFLLRKKPEAAGYAAGANLAAAALTGSIVARNHMR